MKINRAKEERLAHAELLRRVHYDPETGIFTWIKPHRPGMLPGEQAGYVNGNGYIMIEIDCVRYRAHRLAWFYIRGAWPKGKVDHRSRVRSDNRFENLREATHGQNRANSKSCNKHGLKGVNFMAACVAKPWQARVVKDRRLIYLGSFATKEEAHAAYCVAARQLHGEFFNAGDAA